MHIEVNGKEEGEKTKKANIATDKKRSNRIF
jgi:hypothetical protein